MDLLGTKKRRLQKQKLAEKEHLLDNRIEKSILLQKENSRLQSSVTELMYKNQKLNEELKALVEENKHKENILLERENKIRENEKDIEERTTTLRKDEIVIEARKADARKQEQLASEHEKNVIARENEAAELKVESDEAKEKYQTLFDELESQKENINFLEEEANRKNNEADEKEAKANEIFERAKKIDEEINERLEKFEAEREEIENSLKEKIAEYDRRIADLESAKELIDDINYDDSEDGKRAKIVVKEAIRQAKKSLTDIKTQFDELDEKYSSGTFKGFATPISEIDKCFEELKTQYQQIKEHIDTYKDVLPNAVFKWLDKIEVNVANADKNIKSWEFSEAFRNIIFGLSTCKNYELLLTILNDWGGSHSEDNSESENNFTDWYDILEVEPDAKLAEIKKKYREMAKKYHPDVAPEGQKDEYNRLFNLIKQAYDILKDTKKRNEFDEKRNNKQ